MADKPKVNGYIWRQELARATRANERAAEAIARILEERPGPASMALLLATAAMALRENLSALQALKEIAG